MENENTYFVVKDEDGILRALAGMWPAYGRMRKYGREEAEKYIAKLTKKGGKETFVEVKLVEIN